MPNLPEPVKVSPLIKFLRYSFLIAGMIYGASKLKALKIIEEGKKEQREQRKLEREKKIAEEKKAASERDIAQIVAIFTGKPEADAGVTDQSYSKEITKLEPEDVNHTMEQEKTFSDDLSACALEEVKQMVQGDKPGPSSTSNTELGSADQDETSVSSFSKSSVDTRKNNSDNIFSDVFNLTPPKDRDRDIPSIKAKSNATPESNGSGTSSDMAGDCVDKPNKQDGYYIEDFTDRIPYAEPEARKENFFGEDDK